VQTVVLVVEEQDTQLHCKQVELQVQIATLIDRDTLVDKEHLADLRLLAAAVEVLVALVKQD
tara:strand:+ start:101 stop:286 length:186 start_codon:yes stop_codon:yes gene_type:complete